MFYIKLYIKLRLSAYVMMSDLCWKVVMPLKGMCTILWIKFAIVWDTFRLATEEKFRNNNRTVLFGNNASPEFLLKQTISGMWVICQTLGEYHGTRRHGASCHGASCHWASCHVASCNGASCYWASCHGDICLGASCHDAGCYGASWHGASCHGASRNGARCHGKLSWS